MRTESGSVAHWLWPLLLSLGCLLGSTACAPQRTVTAPSPWAQWHPEPGDIFDLRTHERLSFAQLVARLDISPPVLIGEKHDNPQHHLIEARLLERLLKTPGTAVVFEMLSPEQQPAIDRATATSSLDQLKASLEFETSGWDWNRYGPLFQQVLRHDGRPISGNLSGSEIGALYRQTDAGLSDDETASIAAIAPRIRDRLLEEIYQQHCETIARSRLDPMLSIQLARDARMAGQLRRANAGRLRILIAGGYHVRRDLGVPLHLPQQPLSVLMLQEIDATRPPLDGYPLATPAVADFIWFTEATETTDYCARLRDTSSGS